MRFHQINVPPSIRDTGWRFLFQAVDVPPSDSWKHNPEREEGWLHPVFVWCEQRYGAHYGDGLNRFWFSGTNRVLFHDEADAIEFKLRWA